MVSLRKVTFRMLKMMTMVTMMKMMTMVAGEKMMTMVTMMEMMTTMAGEKEAVWIHHDQPAAQRRNAKARSPQRGNIA